MLNVNIHIKISLIQNMCLKFTFAVAMKKICLLGFPGGTVVENLPANAGDTGSSLGLGRSHMPQSD